MLHGGTPIVGHWLSACQDIYRFHMVMGSVPDLADCSWRARKKVPLHGLSFGFSIEIVQCPVY